MMTADLFIIGKVYLVSLVWQMISWPMVRTFFKKLTDKGWPTARLISSLTAGLSIWELANLGWPVNTNWGWLVAGGGLMSLNIRWYRQRKEEEKLTKEGWKMVIMEEYLFLAGLAGITLIRGFLPNIDSLEKFMDFGFINRYLNTTTLPAMDMWQAGRPINYYTFGHFWASGLIRSWGVTAGVGYNLVLGWVAGLALAIAFSVTYHLAGGQKKAAGMIGGLVGAVTTVIAGNSYTLWYLLSRHNWSEYWYADATRFIHNTIHEFPGYSFVVADLHGHVLGLPIVLLFILIFLIWIEKQTTIVEVVMGGLLGIMMMTNTWDTAIYGLQLIVAGGILVAADRKKILPLLKAAGVMGIAAGVTALPWMLSFEPIASGIKMVKESSPWWQIAVLWTGGAITTLMAVMLEGRGQKKLPIRALAITIGLLILIPEIIYAKDIYPDHPRANTMFKLTYQASVMIGLLAGVVWGKLLEMEKDKKLVKGLGLVTAGVILGGGLIFPVKAFPNFYQNFSEYQGLDGEKWLKTKMPEKEGVIRYLRRHRDGKNMVEAVGDSYTELNAVSVFASVPTIEGWRVHEWLWRGGYGSVAEREIDVRTIFETGEQEARLALIRKYNLGWIMVGSDEREKYEINNQQIKELGRVVYENGGTYLVKIK